MSSDNLPSKETQVSDISSARVWKVLDSISEKLDTIEKQLIEVVRIDEKVKTHDKTLSRFGNILDEHSNRLHAAEMYQAAHDLKAIREKIEKLEGMSDTTKVQKDTWGTVAKWLAGLFAAYIVVKIKNG
tara:strand:+ start:458 stop:844 length:387 start_codon:yes stop_codon:yes gene_type:complete